MIGAPRAREGEVLLTRTVRSVAARRLRRKYPQHLFVPTSATGVDVKAWRFIADAPGRLTQCEVPTPSPRAGWALVAVEAAGLCRSDVHLVDQGLAYMTSGLRHRAPLGVAAPVAPPNLTLGHEIAGTIVEVGSDSRSWRVGDRVVSGPPQESGGQSTVPGVTIDGGLAEFCLVPVDRLVRIPLTLDAAFAAVATDAVNVAYQAVVAVGAVGPGDKVGVIGLGGVGMSGVRVALLQGAEVFGVDPNPQTHQAALRVGARACSADATSLADVAPTVIIDFAGTADTTGSALKVVRRAGKVVVVGMHSSRATIDTHELIRGQKTIVGSHGGSRATLTTVMEHLTAGRLQPDIEYVNFAQADRALAGLREGLFPGKRVVVRPQEESTTVL